MAAARARPVTIQSSSRDSIEVLSVVGGATAITVKHTKSMAQAMRIVQKGVLCAQQPLAFVLRHYRALSRDDVGVKGFANYVCGVFGIPTGKKVEDIRAWGKLLECFHVEHGTAKVPEVEGTDDGCKRLVLQQVLEISVVAGLECPEAHAE